MFKSNTTTDWLKPCGSATTKLCCFQIEKKYILQKKVQRLFENNGKCTDCED